MTEPFFSTKGGDHAGLGLAMVEGVIQQHGGFLSLESSVGAGTAVHILLPVAGTSLPQAAAAVDAWEAWFTPRQSFKVEITAQHSPLKSLNFAALRVKDAVADRFRDKAGSRPDVDTQRPGVRVYVHLTSSHCTLSIDTSGEPLFKRGWRADKGEAPLKETLAAAMLAASGWDAKVPLYDPCCGSGTIAIEAAQIACGIAPGARRSFAFEKLLPNQAHVWTQLREEARAAEHAPTAPVFGSDVAFRMVDFAARNAERAGVAQAVQFRGGDALQRNPPTDAPGVMLLNPPYGERIGTAGVAGEMQRGRERAQVDDGGDFFAQLAAHWKKNFAGWSAWVLTPDLKLPTRMRLKESRRVPMWNGPIECRLFRFDMVAGSARRPS
jgi:putative N6-adenine-specific DNA methylase